MNIEKIKAAALAAKANSRDLTTFPSDVLELIERLEAAEKCLFQMQNAAIDLSKKLETSEQRTDEFVARFSRYVGGDGYFWLHDLHDFYDDWKEKP